MCGSRKSSCAMRLGDDDRAPPVGGEVQVVGVGDGHRPAVAAGARVDRGEAVARVVGDPQRAQVPRRRDVLRQRADREVVDDLGGALVDDVDGVGLRVGDVDARRIAADLRRQKARAGGGVDVGGRASRRRPRPGPESARAPAARRARRRGRRGRRPRAAGRRRRRPPGRRGRPAAGPPSARVRSRGRPPRWRGAGWRSRRRARRARRRRPRARRRPRGARRAGRRPMTRTRWRAGRR